MSKLPKGFAWTWATSSVRAVRYRVGDTTRLDEQRRHARRKPVGFGFFRYERLKRCACVCQGRPT